ncbi:MAG TPA: hypothetical protein VF491_02850 [Vicinamibacterales bacterium]
MAALLFVVALLSQAATAIDFTGSWRMVPERSGSSEQAQPITKMLFVIEQSPDQIRLDMTSGDDKPISAVYPLGPAPKVSDEPLGAGQQRAFWQGSRLIVERGGTISGQTVSSKQTLSLSTDGNEMTVERLVIVQHGYTLKGTPNYATVRDVFVRVKP